MGKKGLKIIKDHSKDVRKSERKKLGTLKSLTVQPKTRSRYAEGMQQFYDYLGREGLTLPKKREGMDSLVSDYVEHLWTEGEGRATASNFLAALQDRDPKFKGQLPLAWRLMRTWNTNEVPNRAPPMTEAVLRAMVGWSFFHEEFKFGLSLLVGFYGLLRTGELLSLQAWQFHLTSSTEPAVISLGLTKSGKRQGAAESITLSELPVLQLLWRWKQKAAPHEYLTAKPHIWRDSFSNCLKALQLETWGFRPYSLRRGGATSLFVKVGSLDRVLILGRWTAVKTAKIYLNSGLAMLADIQIPSRQLRPFHTVFYNTVSSIQTLEPALWSRTGGRGNTKKGVKSAKLKAKRASKADKNDLCVVSPAWLSGLSFVRHFFSSLFCLGPGFPRSGGGPGGIKGDSLCSGLA